MSLSINVLLSGLVTMVILTVLSAFDVQAQESCVPGIVTCCFTVFETVVQVFVNEQNFTNDIEPFSGFNDKTVQKSFSFREPSQAASIAIMGRYENDQTYGSFAIKCSCTRPESPWNNVRSAANSGWQWIASPGGVFPAGWNLNNYAGSVAALVPSTSTAFAGLTSSDQCGAVNQADKLAITQTRQRSFVVRNLVQQVPSTGCGVDGPPYTKKPSPPPTGVPTTAVPSRAPNCRRPAFVDVVWVMDSSSSMEEIVPETGLTRFVTLRNFVVEFTKNAPMSTLGTRQGFVQYAGELYDSSENYLGFTPIGSVLPVTDPAALTQDDFTEQVSNLEAIGGTTNTSGALEFVREKMLIPGQRRPGSNLIVVLATDGFPTTRQGATSEFESAAAEQAAARLVEEDGVIFVFLRIGDDYPPAFFARQAQYIYDTTFPTLNDLLYQEFLCFEPSPTSPQPSASPSRNPTSSKPSIVPTSPKPSKVPTTSQPSKVPTTSRPSMTPSTSKPSKVPTSSKPSKSPATSKPSRVPTTPCPKSVSTKTPTPQPALPCMQSGTGWSKAAKSTCWIGINGISKWGWTSGPYPCSDTTIPFDIYVGAGKCQIAPNGGGEKAGYGSLVIDANKKATIKYTITGKGLVIPSGGVKAYIGTTKVGDISPGQMPITVTSTNYAVPGTIGTISGNFYFYIHFDLDSSCV